MKTSLRQGFPDGSVVKNLPANAGAAGDMGSIPRLGRSPRGGNGNPLQYSCLENSMDRGACQAPVPGGYKELDLTEDAHTIIAKEIYFINKESKNYFPLEGLE